MRRAKTDRTTAQLALVFGGVAVMLAAIGLYGVLSYGITRRSSESRSGSRLEPNPVASSR